MQLAPSRSTGSKKVQYTADRQVGQDRAMGTGAANSVDNPQAGPRGTLHFQKGIHAHVKYQVVQVAGAAKQ